jgi:hypothetical protein
MQTDEEVGSLCTSEVIGDSADSFSLISVQRVLPLITDRREFVFRAHERDDVFGCLVPRVGEAVLVLIRYEGNPVSGDASSAFLEKLIGNAGSFGVVAGGVPGLANSLLLFRNVVRQGILIEGVPIDRRAPVVEKAIDPLLLARSENGP